MINNGVFRRIAAAAMISFACATSYAQDAADGMSDEIATARELIFTGDPVDLTSALETFRSLAERDPENIDVLYFRGTAALNLSVFQPDLLEQPLTEDEQAALREEAIESFRKVLEIRPDLAGARLELARALFFRGKCNLPPEDLIEHIFGDDCDEAAHHYRRALATDSLPDFLAEVTNWQLNIIRARKRITARLQVTAAPDTNINAGPSTTTYISPTPLLGLRDFDIGDDRRATSGIGFRISGSADYRHPLERSLFPNSVTRIRVGTTLARSDYKGSRFDSTSLYLRAGPEVLFERARASLLALGDYGWSSGSRDGYGLGLELNGDVRLTDRLFWGGGVEAVNRRYRDRAFLNGPRYYFNTNLAYTLTPAILIGGRLGLNRNRPEGNIYKSQTRSIGAFADFDLPPVLGISGFRTGISYDRSLTYYETLLSPFFGLEPRRDRSKIARLSISNVNFTVYDFAPTLTLVYETRKSNTLGYDYNRTRVEFAFGRVF